MKRVKRDVSSMAEHGDVAPGTRVRSSDIPPTKFKDKKRARPKPRPKVKCISLFYNLDR